MLSATATTTVMVGMMHRTRSLLLLLKILLDRRVILLRLRPISGLQILSHPLKLTLYLLKFSLPSAFLRARRGGQ